MMTRTTFALAMIGVLAAGCRPARTATSDVPKALTRGGTGARAIEAERAAAARDEMARTNRLYATLFGESYVTRLAALPSSGQVPDSRMPWDMHGYAFNKGGTAVQWTGRDGQLAASALAKYEQAFGDTAGAARAWEATWHGNASSPNWYGHCNGAAAAVTRHAEPARSVTINGVTFDTHDIKALLAEVYMSAKVRFLSGSRCERAESWWSRGPAGRTIPTVMGPCEDTNPGAFYLALANFVGRAGYGIVIETYALREVWNLPVWGYTASVTPVSRSEATRLVTGTAADSWAFNPDASAFASVALTVRLADTNLAREPFQGVPPTRGATTREYEFVLEMDATGAIVGGEWVGASQQAHPDFAWIPFEPGTATDDPMSANPHIDAARVTRLWALSRDLNPDALPATLRAPDESVVWGTTRDLQLTVDGRSDGNAFLGRVNALRVSAVPGVTISDTRVGVNGADAVAYPSSGLTPTFHAGVNVITVRWTSSAMAGAQEASFLLWGIQ